MVMTFDPNSPRKTLNRTFERESCCAFETKNLEAEFEKKKKISVDAFAESYLYGLAESMTKKRD